MALRAPQGEAISALLAGRDSFVNLRTGYGKSICFQAPSCMPDTPGVTVVLTPLLSLCQDQVCDLLDRGVAVGKLTSDGGSDQRAKLERDLLLSEGEEPPTVRLLYLTPEGLQKERTREMLASLYARKLLRAIAVDEAHMVSEWGHEFRKSFMEIGPFRREVAPLTPIMALTATATAHVRKDVVKALGLRDPAVVTGSVDRPNLFFEVLDGEKIGSPDDEERDLVTYVGTTQAHGSGIVYCRTRKEVERIASRLCDADIDAAAYHGGLEEGRRKRMQEDWTDGSTRVIVATISFGMGVNKADCRYVVHWDPPSTLENLLQEAGRGGRDGLPATSRIYSSSRREGPEWMRPKKCVAKYCAAKAANGTCRRQILLAHFGEASPSSQPPDASQPPTASQPPCCDLCERRPAGMSISGGGGAGVMSRSGAGMSCGASGGASGGGYTPAWANKKRPIRPVPGAGGGAASSSGAGGGDEAMPCPATGAKASVHSQSTGGPRLSGGLQTPHSAQTLPSSSAIVSRLPGSGLSRSSVAKAPSQLLPAPRKVLGLAADDPYLRSLIPFTPRPGQARLGQWPDPQAAKRALAASAAAREAPNVPDGQMKEEAGDADKAGSCSTASVATPAALAPTSHVTSHVTPHATPRATPHGRPLGSGALIPSWASSRARPAPKVPPPPPPPPPPTFDEATMESDSMEADPPRLASPDDEAAAAGEVMPPVPVRAGLGQGKAGGGRSLGSALPRRPLPPANLAFKKPRMAAS